MFKYRYRNDGQKEKKKDRKELEVGEENWLKKSKRKLCRF